MFKPRPRGKLVPRAVPVASLEDTPEMMFGPDSGFFGQGSGPLIRGAMPLKDGSGPIVRLPGGPVFRQNPAVYGRCLGYLPDVPDKRDCPVWAPGSSGEIKRFLDRLDAVEAKRKENRRGAEYAFNSTPLRKGIKFLTDATSGKKTGAAIQDEAVKLRDGQTRRNLGDSGYLTAIEDQGAIGSCTAQAVIGLAEFLIRAGSEEALDLSRMFLYKATRNLMGVRGDTGAYIRSTIRSMATFGVPPEKYWPYAAALLDAEPSAFHYSYAARFRATSYRRLDIHGLSSEAVLTSIVLTIAAGFPVAFGFPVYRSIEEVTSEMPFVPVPRSGNRDTLLGGHAVLAVGFDNNVTSPEGEAGALIIKNSWGESWGDEGFAYLPYSYVLDGLAVDFWTIFNNEWLDETAFE